MKDEAKLESAAEWHVGEPHGIRVVEQIAAGVVDYSEVVNEDPVTEHGEMAGETVIWQSSQRSPVDCVQSAGTYIVVDGHGQFPALSRLLSSPNSMASLDGLLLIYCSSVASEIVGW